MTERNRGYSGETDAVAYWLERFREQLMREDNIRRKALKEGATHEDNGTEQGS